MRFSRLTALCLAVLITCSTLITVKNTFAAEFDRDYTEADAVMTYLIGDIFGGESVTRAEFTGALVSALKADGGYSGFSFSDVNENTPYRNEIYAAVDMGIVSRADKFMPDAAVTYNQAIKMLVCAIGCGGAAEVKGGYPSGYVYIARRLGVISAADNSEAELTRCDAVVLLYKLLCTTVDTVGIKDGMMHNESVGISKLESLYGLVCEEGVVEANNLNPVSGGSVDKRQYIIVNDISYDYAGDTAELLGRSVYLFHKKDCNTAELIVAIDNDEVKLSADDVTSLDRSSLTVQSENANKKKSYNISGARFIYNGRRVESFSLSDLKGDCAEFVLLDNNKDRGYEYVFVYDRSYLYIDMIKRDTGIITDLNNDEKSTFNPQNPDVSLTVYDESGTLINRDRLKKNDIVAVAASADGEVAIINKCGNKVSGIITLKDSEGRFCIDGEWYRVSGYAQRNYSDVISVGREYTFLLGLDNDIVAVSNYNTEMQYGYLIAAADGDSIFSDNIKLKIYTMSGRIRIFNVEKIKLDGVNGVTADEVFRRLGGSNMQPQLIRYRTNSDGEISAIDTAKAVSEFEDKGENPDADDDDSLKRYQFFTNGSEVKKFTYRSGGQSCMPYFNVNSANIICVPEDEDIKGAGEKEFSVINKSSLRSGAAYPFEVYDLAENGTAGILVIKDQSVKNNTNYMIEEIADGLMPDGSLGKVLTVFGKGKYSEVFLGAEEEARLKHVLKPGDIVEMTLHRDNSVKYIDLVFDGTALAPSSTTVSGLNYEGLSNISYWYGALYYTDGVYAYISKTKNMGGYDYSMSSLINIKINVANMSVINREKTEIRPITASELQDYKSFGAENYFIVVRLNSQAPMEVYAYEL
ncbi:MAG: hypothetical protein Q4E94_01335 [Clostridia bacterium]|nr:hypothetical protein [Clostridia bacterium]